MTAPSQRPINEKWRNNVLTEPMTLRCLQRLLRNLRVPNVPTVGELPALASDWVALLPEMDDTDLEAATTTILRGASPFWPTPGQLLAASPRTERAKAIEDGEKSAAARLFYEVLRVRVNCPKIEIPVVEVLGKGDATTEVQIQAGVKAIGGWRAMGLFEEKDHQWREKEFVAAFLAERAKSKADRKVAALTTSAQKSIGVSS